MEAKLRSLLVGAGLNEIVFSRQRSVKEPTKLLGRLHGGFNAEWKREVSDRLIELMFSEDYGLEEVKQWLVNKFDFDPARVEDVIRIHLPEVWALFPAPADPPAKRHKAGSRNSGFIQRMLGEVKKVHKGAYRPITALAKDSTMSAPRVFSYGKIKTPSGWLQTKFGKAKASAVAPAKAPEPAMKKPDMALYGKYHSTLKSGKNKESVAQFEKMYHDWLLVNDAEYKKKTDVSDVAKQNKARRDREYTEERYINPYKRTIANVKYYSQPENWKYLTTKEKASMYQQIYDLDYIQKQVPEVGANPYPTADSLPYAEMRRAYKMWLKKNNLSDKK
jgi:hypothetical protein